MTGRLATRSCGLGNTGKGEESCGGHICSLISVAGHYSWGEAASSTGTSRQ